MSEEGKIKILKEVLGSSYTRGSETLFFCPKCEHHKKKLSVNISKNVFKCWVCDWSGKNIYRIIRRYGTSANRHEWKSFDAQTEIANFAEILFDKPVHIDEHVKISLPKEFISLSNRNLPNTSLKALNYLKSRGITKKDIDLWKIGYCPTGKYASRIVIPSFNESGEVNYFVTRTYADDWKKYMNPQVSKDIIFNQLYLDFDEELVLVEGVFDAIKAGENSVPLLGSTLNENSRLFYEIIKNDTPVYLSLDYDAHKKTNLLINLFLKYDIEAYLVKLDADRDVGDMTREQFLEKKDQSVVLTPHNYLLSKIARI